MTHVFVAPHPDDVALSCGGLIASLRELGQNVTILTVFSGDGAADRPDALPARGARVRVEGALAGDRGVQPRGIPADWPLAPALAPSWAADEDAARRDPGGRRRRRQALLAALVVVPPGEHPQQPLAGQALIDDLPTQGAVLTDEIIDAAAAGDVMAARRVEDERFAYFAEASVVFLDLPDAVFRGYEGDDELLGAPRADDGARSTSCAARSPGSSRRRSTCPLGVGNHVDHQLCRDVGVRPSLERAAAG